MTGNTLDSAPTSIVDLARAINSEHVDQDSMAGSIINEATREAAAFLAAALDYAFQIKLSDDFSRRHVPNPYGFGSFAPTDFIAPSDLLNAMLRTQGEAPNRGFVAAPPLLVQIDSLFAGLAAPGSQVQTNGWQFERGHHCPTWVTLPCDLITASKGEKPNTQRAVLVPSSSNSRVLLAGTSPNHLAWHSSSY